MDTLRPEDLMKLSKIEKVSAFAPLMFFKERQDGRLKSRHCVNVASQREYISKEEAASPTGATESIFTTAATSVFEKMRNRTFNIPNAFVNTESD